MPQKRIIHICVLAALLFVLCAAPAFGADGDGTGGGNGENRDIALTLESASISDGAADVPTDHTFQLNFNKNICNVTVLPNNKKCFHLTDVDGNAVPIQLVFPDNQVQKTYRREAFIKPVNVLKPDSTYRLSVDRTLQAKNGTVIDNAHTLTFTTGSRKAKEENKILKKLGENVITYETAYGETADSVPVDLSGLDQDSGEAGPDTDSIAKLAAMILVTLVLLFTVIFLYLRRKKE
ncbi:MAG: hypothetical protein HFE75_14740 [Firmicutes bacterium]|jgi:hypothetical protein|nr:hypothetical protein [Bacillota bacterium]NBI61717.1 hypothetical protein [Clostridiales bacterium]